MSRQSDRRRRLEWSAVLLSLAVLAACLSYTFAMFFLAPDPGVTLNTGWTVIAIDACADRPGWCEAHPGHLQVGDQLLAIGGLAYDTYQEDRRRVPFGGYGPGDRAPLVVRRGDYRQTIYWQMPPVAFTDRFQSLGGLLFYLPFWLAGTVVLLFLRPRDVRWRLLVVFNYLTALWLAAGMISQSHVAASSLVAHAVSWLLAPACLHLHLSVPTPLLQRRRRTLLLPLYAVAAALALLELFQLLPDTLAYLALILAIVASLGLLVRRLFDRSSTAARSAARLMLAGIGLALIPGLLLGLVPSLIDPSAPGQLAIVLSLLAVPILPLSYTYVVYKRRLGTLEFRANRLLGWYSFLLLSATLLALVFIAGSQWLTLSGDSLIFSLAVSIVFIVTLSVLYPSFQRLVNRLVYSTTYDPDDVVRAFANQIPAALDLAALVRLLTDRVTPSLLVRQSALYLLAGGQARLIYASGVHLDETPEAYQRLEQLLASAGRYRPIRDENVEAEDEWSWVRLAIPLKLRSETAGAWVFGRRDPDDYYSYSDIVLLATLADQVAVALQNIQLYEQAQREIADRRHAEAALRESEKRYRNLFNRVPVGLYRTTPLGQILEANPALVQMLGYPDRQSLLATNAADLFVHPEERGREQALLDHDDIVRGFEAQLRRYDGTIIWVRDTSRAVRDADGQLLSYEGSLEDVTERKHLEDQLRHAQKMEAVGRLAGGVAHDFNNVLTAITGYTSLLLSDLASDRPLDRAAQQAVRADLEEVERAADRATALTHQLLAFSRRQVLQLRTLDLNELVHNLEKMLRRLIGEDVELRTVLEPALGKVRADPVQIEQVILNLAVNARDAMPQGGRLTLETANVTLDQAAVRGRLEVRPGPYVRLSVSDTGAGMDEEIKSHLFEPFFTTKERGKGTGLGLATVFGIVKQSGGDIQVHSEPDQGAAFEIYLPRERDTSRYVEKSPPAARSLPGSETILLVEDEETVRLLVQRVLQRRGYTVLEACDAHDALSLVQRYDEPIHLLVTDVIMPGGMSGWDLAQRLASTRKEMKVLYMSGYPDDVVARPAAAGAELNFIPKPFTTGDLAQKVRQVLDG